MTLYPYQKEELARIQAIRALEQGKPYIVPKMDDVDRWAMRTGAARKAVPNNKPSATRRKAF